MGGKGKRGGAKARGKGYEWRRAERSSDAAGGNAPGSSAEASVEASSLAAAAAAREAALAAKLLERREHAADTNAFLCTLPILRPALAYLRFREMLRLEATCFSMRETLTDRHSPGDWAYPGSFNARYWCLAVPPTALMQTPPRELKRTFAALRHLSGCPTAPARLLNGEELAQVANICEQVSAMNQGQKRRVQVVVGRLRFDTEDLACLVDPPSPSATAAGFGPEEHTVLPEEETVFCFSSDVEFRWPGCIGFGEPCADLALCVGCTKGQAVIEINSPSWPPALVLSLSMDVHFADPRLPSNLTFSSLRIPVCQMGGCCSMPALDISDPVLRDVMTSEEGMLVVFAIRDIGDMCQRPGLRPRSHAVTVRNLNALVLASASPLVPRDFLA